MGKELRSEAKVKHDNYKISIVGCSNTVYGVIGEGEKDMLASALASQNLVAEHPRKGEFIEAIKAMKYMFYRGAVSYDWLSFIFGNDDVSLESNTSSIEGVTTGEEVL